MYAVPFTCAITILERTKSGGAAARAGDPGLGEAARRELESARRGRGGVCAEEQEGAAGGRRRGEGRVRVRRGVHI